ncbi:MAG: S46 family peptidase [Bacteroidetes bacterium]|nr:MAG: S46 family peptidase [Bacteroidota bacterium]
MKKLLLSLGFISSLTLGFSEEGMLIPSLLSAFESDMQAKGMKLTADQIYSVNHSSIKDAIMHFGGGCTAELVSKKGLLLTNHHCGYSQIQSHSSLEKDYLKNGFWAKNFSEELANPGLTAARVVRIEDVTKSVLFGVKESDNESEQMMAIQKNIQKLVEDAQEGNHYKAEIRAFNYGNDFYMIIKEIFSDVRLVGTPPNSIGKFGGDTDNWVWPRHTGDFSVFRIYAGTDNKPAEYSENNVPYTPLHFLPISFKNRKKGDFTMVYGFPGSTEQHLVSDNLKYLIDQERPARIKMRELSLSVIDAAMRSSDETRIKYSAKQARIANAYKKWIGQIGGLKELNALEKKLAKEKKYLEMANSKDAWKKKYGPIIGQMNELMKTGAMADFRYQMGIEYLYVGPELFKMGRTMDRIVRDLEKWEKEGKLDEEIKRYQKGGTGFFKDFDAQVDQKIFELLTDEYHRQLKLDDFMNSKNSVQALSQSIYSKSVLIDPERYHSFLEKLSSKSLKKLDKDPGYVFYKKVRDRFMDEHLAGYRGFKQEMDRLLKVYVAGKYEMFPNEAHWADANSTLRITYGQLEGSAPRDGMAYTEHTTLDGIIQKYNTGNPDFEIKERMVELANKREYGPYAQDGELWVCFTGSNHTTGGNSGSPVLDENGYLMGLNFDRSWESTMSDYHFDASRCRNIVVDIRYVMWVMDVYSGARHLVDEMTLKK